MSNRNYDDGIIGIWICPITDKWIIMANEAHKIKLLVLWDILCKNTDENHVLNTDEISEFFALRGLNVSRKILVRDIADFVRQCLWVSFLQKEISLLLCS